MSKGRARIQTIIMCNWRGIPFQILDMHKYLTALEGRNGAGKTTVMTAFYIAIMPFLSLVKVLNVGDTDGSGGKDKGLHGKLGKAGDSYTILEFVNPRGVRIIAGVILTPKAAPCVEISKLFIIEKLPDSVPLESILIHQQGAISTPADLPTIQQQVALHGGETTICKSASQYGDELFKQGILPINLIDKKSRTNFNKLLQTSFQGGFSENLQDRLKDYLLGEDIKISEGIARMQDLLRSCQKQRARLESLGKTISSVEEIQLAGVNMAKGLICGVRLREVEQRAIYIVICKEFKRLKNELVRLQKAKKQLAIDLSAANATLKTAKSEHEYSKNFLLDAEKAHRLAEDSARVNKELAAITKDLEEAQQAKDAAEAALTDASQALRALHDEQSDVSIRLSNAEESWRRISHEAGFYKAAIEALVAAQEALPIDQTIAIDMAEAIFEESRVRAGLFESKTGEAFQTLSLAEQVKKSFLAAHSLVESLARETVAHPVAHQVATDLDLTYRDLENCAAHEESVATDLKAVTKNNQRKQDLLSELDPLKEHGLYIDTPIAFKGAYTQACGELDKASESKMYLREQLGNVERNLQQQAELKEGVKETVNPYGKAIARRKSLESSCKTQLLSRRAVQDALNRESGHYADLVKKQGKLETTLEELQVEISALVTNETQDPRLEKVERALDGKIAASLYDDIELDEAGEKEARLGPLVNAIIVEDVPSAIEKLDTLSDVPDDVWLVQKGEVERELYHVKKLSNAIAAKMENAWRVTQIPAVSQLGVKSRRKKAEALRIQRVRLREDLVGAESAILKNNQAREELNLLLAEFYLLEGDSPHDKLAKIGDAEDDLSREKRDLEFKLQAVADCRKLWTPIKELLDHWQMDSHLLGGEGFEQQIKDLSAQLAKIEKAKETLGRDGNTIKSLRTSMECLRSPPMTDSEIKTLEQTMKGYRQNWTDWTNARDRLKELVDKLGDFRFKDSFERKQTQDDPGQALRQRSKKLKSLVEEAGEKEKAARDALGQKTDGFNELNSQVLIKKARLNENQKELDQLNIDGSPETLQTAQKDYKLKRDAEEEANARVNNLVLAERDNNLALQAIGTKMKEAALNRQEGFETYRLPRAAMHLTKSVTTSSPALTHLWTTIAEVKSEFQRSVSAFSMATENKGALRMTFSRKMHGDEEYPIDSVMACLERPFSTFPGDEEAQAQEYLDLWQAVVNYISQILPRDIVHTDDPVEASRLMKERYASIAKLLEGQEQDFRSDSRDVANSIRGRINAESRKVNKINTHLDGISFGNIAKLQIDFTRNREMMNLLEAMHDQKDLFTEDVPLPEAMRRVYERISGGEVRGDELLDYRKYITLNVKILRKSETQWEVGTPLSTGEAIGAGAAILAVILGSWEESASLVKDRDLQNSMRFLFMDEATRLDPDSIQTLLEFCTQMGIQLLIAGPRFDEEECGGGITYRLARKNLNGAEHVVIRGRKGFGGSFFSQVTA
jgi:chromosome partition protein MukB